MPDSPNPVCLATEGLSHRYEGGASLHAIALSVPAGSIYGLLGPNGAGKTSTLRLVLGLIRQQQGTVSILGQSLATHRLEILKRVGALIESPSLYEHLSAEENLALLQRTHRLPRSRIDETLARVGLANARSKRVGQFSLGMKQRLGIAAAILHRPALLILDEPTNGLDPNGIIEMRELLLALNREEGTTLLVSSHLLAEIERLATHIGVMHEGRLLFQGTLDELRLVGRAASSVALRTADDPGALRVLARIGIAARPAGGGIEMPAMTQAQVAQVNRCLVEHGVDVHAIGRTDGDLESVFMHMIGRRAA